MSAVWEVAQSVVEVWGPSAETRSLLNVGLVVVVALYFSFILYLLVGASHCFTRAPGCH